MRILNVTESYAPFYEFGGPPAKVEALSRGLVERGNEVTVLTTDWGLRRRIGDASPGSSFRRTQYGWCGEDRGVKAIYLRTWLRYRATSWNPAIGKYLATHLSEFDAVHIFGLYDLLGPRVAKASRNIKLPYVVEPIGMFVPIVRSVWLKRIYHSLYGREMLAGAGRLIATSEQEVRELTEGGIPPGQIVLRRNGVMGPGRVPERGTYRRNAGIMDDALVVLFLGRLSEKKSPDLLLRAFAALPEKLDGKTLQLVFAGPDEQGMEAKLRSAASELRVDKRVKFTGAIFGEEKWAAYRDADVFVLPSQNENFGNTAAEAAAVGTPVIVTENCGVAPLLTDAGIIVPHEEKALVQAVGRLLQDGALRVRLGAQAIIAAANIGWEEPVRETESLYRKLAQLQ